MTTPTPPTPPPPSVPPTPPPAPMPAPVPYLRRNPAPSQATGRWVLLGVLVFFLMLVAFVIVLVVVIGLHNHGVKIPPGPAPHATQPS